MVNVCITIMLIDKKRLIKYLVNSKEEKKGKNQIGGKCKIVVINLAFSVIKLTIIIPNTCLKDWSSPTKWKTNPQNVLFTWDIFSRRA